MGSAGLSRTAFRLSRTNTNSLSTDVPDLIEEDSNLGHDERSRSHNNSGQNSRASRKLDPGGSTGSLPRFLGKFLMPLKLNLVNVSALFIWKNIRR